MQFVRGSLLAFILLLALRAKEGAQGLSHSFPDERVPMCPRGPIALVLSGGGAKGMAHIGVIRMLDSLGIRPALVVGTSIGALIGALYASGYSGQQIDSLARALPLAPLFQGKYTDLPRLLLEWPPLAVLDQGRHGFQLRLPAPRAQEVNGLLNELLLRGNLMARGRFDALPVPLRVVATDLRTGEPIVLVGGDLAQSVRASMALPLVLPSQPLGGRTLVDGGLSANVPARQARAAGATRLVVSDVTDGLPESTDPESLTWWLVRLWDLVNVQQPESLEIGDVLVRPDVRSFPDLDFSPQVVSELIHRGEAGADSALLSARCPLLAAADTPGTLPVRLARVTITGGSDADARLLSRLLPVGVEPRFSLAGMGSVLDRLRSTGRYEEVWLNPSGSPDSLVLDIRVRPVSRRLVTVGVAYHGDVGPRLWVSAMDRRFGSDAIAASGALLLGRLRQEARLGVRYTGRKPDNALVALTAGFAREHLRTFDGEGDVLGGWHTREIAAFLGPELSLGGNWHVAVGLEGRLWNEPLGNRTAAGVGARADRGRSAGATFLRADGSWTSAYRRVEMQLHGLIRVGRSRVTPQVGLGWGRSLPPQRTFALGGPDGFPGLHLGERRGDRETSLRLSADHPVTGPLLAHVELAAGQTAVGGPVFPQTHWEVGAAFGLGIDTPAGPIRVEYGRATGDRKAIVARVGTWF